MGLVVVVGDQEQAILDVHWLHCTFTFTGIRMFRGSAVCLCNGFRRRPLSSLFFPSSRASSSRFAESGNGISTGGQTRARSGQRHANPGQVGGQFIPTTWKLKTFYWVWCRRKYVVQFEVVKWKYHRPCRYIVFRHNLGNFRGWKVWAQKVSLMKILISL